MLKQNAVKRRWRIIAKLPGERYHAHEIIASTEEEAESRFPPGTRIIGKPALFGCVGAEKKKGAQNHGQP